MVQNVFYVNINQCMCVFLCVYVIWHMLHVTNMILKYFPDNWFKYWEKKFCQIWRQAECFTLDVTFQYGHWFWILYIRQVDCIPCSRSLRNMVKKINIDIFRTYIKTKIACHVRGHIVYSKGITIPDIL